LSFEHVLTGLTLVPRNIVIRGIVLIGLVAPWVWLVAVDRLLNRKR
jgi:hypothetical protein